MPPISNDWLEPLSGEFRKPYYAILREKVVHEYNTRVIYPPKEDLFNAFHYTPLADVKVVIIGQDPYHEAGQANGLSFSVRPGVTIPPSLENIFKEIKYETGCYIPNSGDLSKWARQGVLLLNNVLTVREHVANSHRGYGWEKFTEAAILAVEQRDDPVVYMLWGKPAQTKAAIIKNKNHLVLTAPHPSPLSSYRGFFGCGHFKKANEFLVAHGEKPIDWQIENV